MFLAGFQSGLIPKTQYTQPPDEIPPAVAARRTVMRADGQVDLAPGAVQFICNLRSG